MHRSHEDHRAGLLPVHVRQAGLCGEERTIEVNGQKPLPLGKGKVLGTMDNLHAGIGDQDIDRTPVLHNGGNALNHRVLVGHIHGHWPRSGRCPTACQFLGRRGSGLGVQVSDSNPWPLRPQSVSQWRVQCRPLHP